MIQNPVPWPNGARCAAAITFDMDADSLVQIGRPEKAADMVSTTSMLRYGPQIGVPRILETYRKLDIRQTFFVPGWSAEQHPEAVEAIVSAGHEIALHSYIHELSYDMPREEEHYWLRRALDALTRISGHRPRGWRAPMYSFSSHSADLLIEEGFVYDASLMGDDVPYVLETDAGRLLELPTHWGVDDYPQYAHKPDLDYMMPVKAPSEAVRNYREEFEAHYACGGLWIPVWHPYLTGRLARWWHIEKMLEEIRARGDVWFAPLEEIASHVQACIADGRYAPRVERMPMGAGRVSLHRPETRG